MKQIIASGGGGFTQERSALYDYYVLASSNVERPKIGFLPTAGGDNSSYCYQFYHTFSRLPCSPSIIEVVSPNTDLKKQILEQDIIYVGGGNTKSMLGLWKEWEVDKFLKEAYENETILSGISAGAVCWFEECLSDCYPGTLTPLQCLSFIKGSSVVHYESSKEKQRLYPEFVQNKTLKPGYAINNFAALHFIDDELARCVTTHERAKAEFYALEEDKIAIKPIDTVLLSEEANLNKYIVEPLNMSH